METGAGALMPAVYYNTFHKGYQKTAYFTNKNFYRMDHSRSVRNQVAKADSVRTNLSNGHRLQTWIWYHPIRPQM